MKPVFSFLCIACAVLPHLSVSAQDRLAMFYAPFDGSPVPATAGDSAVLDVHGTPEYIDGVRGKAIVVSPDSWIVYPLPGNLNPAQGAIEFWLKPVDWDGKDGTQSHFFVGAAGADRLFVYKFARWRHFTVHVSTDDAPRYESLKAGIYPWKTGEWHHAVVTWDAAYLRIYLDGEMASEASMPSPITDLGKTLAVGKDLATPQMAAGKTAIDELRIYPRPLFPEEVRRAYGRRENPQAPLQPYEDLIIYYTGFPSENRASLSFVSSMPVPPQGAAELLVQNAADGRVAARYPLEAGPAGDLVGRDIRTDNLPPALYRLAVRITDAEGAVRLERTKDLWFRDTDWKRTREGIPEAVPPPWVPIEVDGMLVRVWNREYHLADGAIDAIQTAGREVLASPAGLMLDGQMPPVLNDWRLLSHTPLKAVFESGIEVDGHTVTQRATFEFDGFIRLDCTLPAGITLPPLALSLPMKPDVAKYATTATQREKYYFAGAVRPGAWPASQVFHIWMGDEDRGLSLMLEGAKGWPTEPDDTQLELNMGNRAHALRAHVSRTPTTLNAPLTLSFGIEATPVRPMPAGWRSGWRLSPEVGTDPTPELATEYGATHAIIWWSERTDTPRWFAYPEPSDPDAFAKLIADFHRRGVKVLIYENLTNVSPNVPEAVRYSGEWFPTPTPVQLPAPDQQPPPERWERVRLKHPDWTDFIVGSEARVIDRFGVDGWYFDCALPYEVDGIHPVFEYREACKRAYVALKKRNPDGDVITHMSSHYIAPALAFTDAMLPGEQFRWPLPHWQVEDDYTKVLSLDYARTELTGRNLGVVPVFLPEFPGGGHRTERNSWHLAAFTRLHDINVWPIWTDPRPFRALWRMQNTFGIGDSDVAFLPYWDHPPAETDADSVLVSAYRKPGKAMLIVSNFLGQEPVTARVRPDSNALRLTAECTAEDALSGEPIAVERGAFSVDIPEGRARIVILSNP
jgi:hypothetical protein